MAGDDDSDVRRALAVFGAAPIGYRNFRPAPLPAEPAAPPARPPEPTPTRLTLQWPARSFARRPDAFPGEAPVQSVASLRPVSPHPVPAGAALRLAAGPGPQPVRAPTPSPGARLAPVAAAAPRSGKLPLTAMFRTLADPPAEEATPLALPPMFRRL